MIITLGRIKKCGIKVNGSKKEEGTEIATYPYGGRNEGSFVNNLPSGNKIFLFIDSLSYVGSCNNDLKYGKGIFYVV